MKAFQFKLQRVLDIRILKEDMARIEFHRANQQLQILKDKLESLQEDKGSIYQYLRNRNLSPQENIMGRNYLSIKRKKINEVKQKLIAQKKFTAELRKELINRKKKKEIMEKLKEKDREKHYKKIDKIQQKELDEIALAF